MLEAAEQLGWLREGIDGAGHHRLRHPESGAVTSVPATPRDWRSEANSIADLERLSGRKLPRQRTGRSSYKGGSGFNFRVSESSRAASNDIASLRAEADTVLDRFQQIAGEPHRNRVELAELAKRWEELSDQLEDKWQPPLPALQTLIKEIPV